MKSLISFINECEENPSHISELGDGIYSGIMSGYNFDYNGKRYKCDFGVRGINMPMTLTIKNGKVER